MNKYTTSGTSALQPIQDKPAFSVVIVEKPAPIFAPVCPSALREAKSLWAGYGANAGRMFEALQYDQDLRIFQALDNGATYHLKVTAVQIEQQAFTASFINGRIVDTQQWKISVSMAMKYSWLGYLPTVQDAINGAYDCLQVMVMGGKV